MSKHDHFCAISNISVLFNLIQGLHKAFWIFAKITKSYNLNAHLENL